MSDSCQGNRDAAMGVCQDIYDAGVVGVESDLVKMACCKGEYDVRESWDVQPGEAPNENPRVTILDNL
jgi:hypothetical protein